MEKMNFKKLAVTSLTIAAASIASMSVHAEDAKKDDKKAKAAAEFKCEGATECAGKGGCKSATNECAGKNGCGGKGWVMTKDKKACEEMKAAHSKKGA